LINDLSSAKILIIDHSILRSFRPPRLRTQRNPHDPGRSNSQGVVRVICSFSPPHESPDQFGNGLGETATSCALHENAEFFIRLLND
jgi:hypothetical protein